MDDSLILEVADFEHDVLTGIYSEETGKPQPLRITIEVHMRPMPRYEPDTTLDASKNYMDLKHAATEALPDGDILVVYYEGTAESMQISWVRLAV